MKIIKLMLSFSIFYLTIFPLNSYAEHWRDLGSSQSLKSNKAQSRIAKHPDSNLVEFDMHACSSNQEHCLRHCHGLHSYVVASEAEIVSHGCVAFYSDRNCFLILDPHLKDPLKPPIV